MDLESVDPSKSSVKVPDPPDELSPTSADSGADSSPSEAPPSKIFAGKSTFSLLTSGLGLLSSKAPASDNFSEAPSTSQSGFVGNLTKGIVDTSKNAVKAVQLKARHAVSQNKRRYQEGEFDLDMTYITENIIAMGFPAGDLSSGFFGYVEGFYRNHMDEVIRFFETRHKDKYKVYNLCSERLYDASLFEGKVASFPFDDHNCPPIQLITSFCQSAYTWLKGDIENVVVVHCKAGMARTGLMICSLLLYLKFFPTSEESIVYYNQKRCVDGKGLVLPSQIRYVKYFERILTYFNGENQPGRRCMLRGFRFHRCPSWIRPAITVSDHNGVLFSTKKHPRTKDMLSEDIWLSAPKKGIMVFALPGEPGLTELAGDFKIHFHDRHGDFYCWLNTTMMENRTFLNTSDLDGFDKRRAPSPGFQVEIVMAELNSSPPSKPKTDKATNTLDGQPETIPAPSDATPNPANDSGKQEKEAERSGSSKSSQTGGTTTTTPPSSENTNSDQIASLTKMTEQVSVNTSTTHSNAASEPKSEIPKAPIHGESSEFKIMAADASVFTFGDEDDYESE